MDSAKTLHHLRNMAERGRTKRLTNKLKKLKYLRESETGKTERSYNHSESVDQLKPMTNIESRTALKSSVLNLGHEYTDRLTQSQLNEIYRADQQGFDEDFNPQNKTAIWCVSQQKGGSGKSILATTLASAFATERLGKYRVGLIDLDPQATSTMALKPNFDCQLEESAIGKAAAELEEADFVAHFSVGDILNGTYELDDDETFEQFVSSCFYPTTHENLRVLCAREEDRKYEIEVERKRQEANKSGESYIAYNDLQRIVDAVKDEFDIILIDTTPYFSTATSSAHFVANNIIMPFRPAENDLDGIGKHIDHLAHQYEVFSYLGHQGYYSTIVQPMAVDRSNKAQKNILNRARDTYQRDYNSNIFPNSSAVTHCSSSYQTIFDLSKSEFEFGTKKTLLKIQEETQPLLDSIEDATLAFLAEKGEN